MSKRSFEIVHNIASPYRLHMFGEMRRQLAERGIDFHVHFMSDMSRGYKDRPKTWLNPQMDFPHTYWRDWGYSHYAFNPGLICHLLRHRPDWLLVGSCYDTFTGICSSLLCPARQAKICWLEGNTKIHTSLRGAVAGVKHLVMSRFKYVGVPGTDAVRFIALHQENTRLKMPTPVLLPNIVDETRFKPRNAWPEEEIVAKRKRLGVAKGEKLALTPARLEPVKGLVPYLERLDPDLLRGWKIVILGNGSLHDIIAAVIGERGLAERVSIINDVPYEEMPKVYAAADLFVLPSVYDHNPLSVVEALHCGLPVAVSDQAGNVEDAVSNGKNGWVLPVKEAGGFAAVLTEVFSTSLERLRDMGTCSHDEKARFWNTKESISRFLGIVLSKGRTQP